MDQFGEQKALEFLTGYVIEKAFSVDNLFVFLMVFSYFHVSSTYQHKILFRGVPIIVSLGVVAAILIASAALSVMRAHLLEYRARELKKLQEHE